MTAGHVAGVTAGRPIRRQLSSGAGGLHAYAAFSYSPEH